MRRVERAAWTRCGACRSHDPRAQACTALCAHPSGSCWQESLKVQLGDTVDLAVAVGGESHRVLAILDAPRPSGGCGALLRVSDLLGVCGETASAP